MMMTRSVKGKIEIKFNLRWEHSKQIHYQKLEFTTRLHKRFESQKQTLITFAILTKISSSSSFKVPLNRMEKFNSVSVYTFNSHSISVRCWYFIGLIFRSVIRYSKHFPTLDRSRSHSTCLCSILLLLGRLNLLSSFGLWLVYLDTSRLTPHASRLTHRRSSIFISWISEALRIFVHCVYTASDTRTQYE